MACCLYIIYIKSVTTTQCLNMPPKTCPAAAPPAVHCWAHPCRAAAHPSSLCVSWFMVAMHAMGAVTSPCVNLSAAGTVVPRPRSAPGLGASSVGCAALCLRLCRDAPPPQDAVRAPLPLLWQAMSCGQACVVSACVVYALHVRVPAGGGAGAQRDPPLAPAQPAHRTCRRCLASWLHQHPPQRWRCPHTSCLCTRPACGPGGWVTVPCMQVHHAMLGDLGSGPLHAPARCIEPPRQGVAGHVSVPHAAFAGASALLERPLTSQRPQSPVAVVLARHV